MTSPFESKGEVCCDPPMAVISGTSAGKSTETEPSPPSSAPLSPVAANQAMPSELPCWTSCWNAWASRLLAFPSQAPSEVLATTAEAYELTASLAPVVKISLAGGSSKVMVAAEGAPTDCSSTSLSSSTFRSLPWK